MRLLKAKPRTSSNKGPLWWRKLRRHLFFWGPFALMGLALVGVVVLVRGLSPNSPDVVEENPAEEPVQVSQQFDDAMALWSERGESATERVRAALEPLVSFEDKSLVGPPEAHLWIAEDLLLRSIEESGTDRRETEDLAIRHLLWCIRRDPLNAAAHFSLAQVYRDHDQLEEARQLLEEAVADLPSLRAMLASVLESQGAREAAGKQAEEAVTYFTEALRTNPDDFFARLEWARADLVLGQEERAQDLLRTTPSGSREQRAHDDLRVSLRMAQAMRALRAQPRRTGEALDKFEEALSIRPNHEEIHGWISDLAYQLPEIRPRARVIFERLLDNPRASAKVSFSRGMLDLADGNPAGARPHLQRAVNLDPSDLLAKNNLAWCLAHMAPPQLDNALKLIQEVSEADEPDLKDHPLYLDTQGEIMVLVGIRDLERARGGQSAANVESTDATLKEAFEALGIDRES